MRHFFLPVTVCALAQCADREHAKAMRERIDGEVQKRWRRSVALVSAAADGDEDRVRTELINYAHPDSADSTSYCPTRSLEQESSSGRLTPPGSWVKSAKDSLLH